VDTWSLIYTRPYASDKVSGPARPADLCLHTVLSLFSSCCFALYCELTTECPSRALCLLVIVRMATLGIKSVRVIVCEHHNLCLQDFTYLLHKHGDPRRYRHTSDREPQAIPLSGNTSSHEDSPQCTSTSTFRAQESQHRFNDTAGKIQTPRVYPTS
jgi:hypothetical protein